MPRGDLDEAQEERLKQLFLVRRAYGAMLARRLRDDTRKCDRLESAFQRIRGATGLVETSDIVAKFLRRDETFQSLQEQMASAREHIEHLKNAKRKLAWELDEAKSEAGFDAERRTLYTQLEEQDRRV